MYLLQTVLDAILPQYLRHVQRLTDSEDNAPAAIKAELSSISSVAVAMRALLSGAENLGRCGLTSGLSYDYRCAVCTLNF